MLSNKPIITFIVPYPLESAPSQRFRFEQYMPFLSEKFTVETHSFISSKAWINLYKKGNTIGKIWSVILGFVKRFGLLFRLGKTDFVFIHREASPIGPPFFEWVIANILKKKIIYDFDDAIWLSNTSSSNSIIRGLKWHSKVRSICRWSYKVTCGNEFLADFAKQFNSNVIVIPTTIDTDNEHNKTIDYQRNTKVIGWTGSHSTIQYLDDFIPILRQLAETETFTFLVISDLKPTFELEQMRFVPWSKTNEIEVLSTIDIGIMPLPESDWTRGKCGFKGLQYMALGIPAVVSPVGVNKDIIQNNNNGCIATTPEEWISALKRLLNDTTFSSAIGLKGQQTILSKYSVNATKQSYFHVFE